MGIESQMNFENEPTNEGGIKTILDKISEKHPNLSKVTKGLCVGLAMLAAGHSAEAFAGDVQVENLSNTIEASDTVKLYSEKVKSFNEAEKEKFFAELSKELGVDESALTETYKHVFTAEAFGNSFVPYVKTEGEMPEDASNIVFAKYFDNSVIETEQDGKAELWDYHTSETRVYSTEDVEMVSSGDAFEVGATGATVDQAIKNALNEIIGNQVSVNISVEKDFEQNIVQTGEESHFDEKFADQTLVNGTVVVSNYKVLNIEEAESDSGSKSYKVILNVQLGTILDESLVTDDN